MLVVSTVLWCILPVLPFLDLTVVQLASYTSAVFIAAEITWWACIPLLGKEFIDKIKRLLRYLWPGKAEEKDETNSK